jgi:F like protein
MSRLALLYNKQSEPSAAQQRIEALLSNYRGFVRAQFDLFLSSVRDPATLAEVEEALSEKRINDALSIVDRYVFRFGDALVQPISAIGGEQAAILAEEEGLSGAGVAVSFNPASSAIVEATQRNRLQFIRDFGADQRAVVSQALTESARLGENPVDAARRFRDSIGLTAYQEQMVSRYQRLLETNNARALDRELRDRRYDRGFENAIAGDYALPQDRIDTMVSRYRARLLQLRGETIARTESGRVAEEVRNITTLQALDRAGIDRELAVKQWSATRDPRTRDTHAAMDGQARWLADTFDSPSGAMLMYPHDSDAPAAETINCRCTVTYQVFQTWEEVQAFLAANGQGRYGN